MPEIKIIHNAKLKSFPRNVSEWSFTMLIWALWLYLFLPLFNIILWLLGIHLFYEEVIEKAGYLQLLSLFTKMGWSILVVFAVLRLWGYYNYLRFRKKDRRKFVSSTTVEQLSVHFNLPPEQIIELQSKKEVTWPL
jgi:poly-beta-1,6-N-acetyl-D-glucosamine biosynthesis protein PgaD